MQTEDFADNNMMNLANEQKMTSFFAGEIEGKEPLLDEWEVSIWPSIMTTAWVDRSIFQVLFTYVLAHNKSIIIIVSLNAQHTHNSISV